MEYTTLKKIINRKREKEFDTRTLVSDIDIDALQAESDPDDSAVSENTRQAVDLKTISEAGVQASEDMITQVYEPRPLTPEDDIYEDIIEQFASAPTKTKYWFEEFGDYWSCSCGHINRGDKCKSCGLERELLRSLFILHKPADSPGKLNRKLNKAAREQSDKEERQQAEKENRRKQREASGDDGMTVVPIETETDEDTPVQDPEEENTSAAPEPETSEDRQPLPPAVIPSDDHDTKKKLNSFKVKIIAAIIICLLLIGGGGIAIYHYMAAPAIQYQEAQQLQADGKYEKAIEKYKALGDYKDCSELIWQCYCSMADEYFEAGKFKKAIDTYNIALETKDDEAIHDKIWQCYIGIGDRHLSAGEYESALSTYYVAADLKDNETVQEKINQAKLAYVKAYQGDRTARVEEYMSDLMSIKYPGIQEIYDSYYAWHVKIIANTSESDFSTDMDTISRKDTAYFHATLSGGEPSEQIMLYYEVTWPSGDSQIYNLDSSWGAGSKITARFQYPIPLFGKEGKLTFRLYDKSTNELMGSDSITFKN